MNPNPDNSAPTPEPTPVDQPPIVPPVAAAPAPAPVILKAPVKLAPPSVGLRAPGLSAPAAPAAAPAPVAAPAPAPAAPANLGKLPERPKFVSPMPVIEDADAAVPAFLPILAGIAAAASISFAVLLYLKSST